MIVVFGASGQVGSALLKLLGSRGRGFDFPEADFSKPETLAPFLDHLHPEAVINAAAYTQVDKAETEEKLAYLINAEAPGAIARWCAMHGEIPFIHYSTDYVFSGEGDTPWKEEDPVAPLNAYGRTKLAGEGLVAGAGGRWLVFRTSWVYDAYGKNFLKTMLKFGQEREILKVVADQTGAPTYAPHLAQATLTSLEAAQKQAKLGPFPSGIYHLCGGGETTWHGFASAIFEEARQHQIPLKVKTLEAVPSSEYPTPAKRPTNSRLHTEKARQILGVALPAWKLGLADCLFELKNSQAR